MSSENDNPATYLQRPSHEEEEEFLLENEGLRNGVDLQTDISLDDIPQGTDDFNPKRSKCTNFRLFITTVSFFILSMGCLEMYILSIITTLEKQFGLSSFYSGMLISWKELMFALLGAVLSHIAKYLHRPRFLSGMGFLAVIGGLMSALPHFIFVLGKEDVTLVGNHSLGEFKEYDFCLQTNSSDINDNNSLKNEDIPFNSRAYLFLVFSAILMGISNCTLTPVAVTYIDDGANTKNNGLYLGIIQSMKPLGPLLAFLCGGFFMKFYTTLHDPGFDNTSPQWIGAWWLGYIVFPALLFVISILLLPFPRMPENEDLKLQYAKQYSKDYESKAIKDVIKSFFSCLRRLCTNHIYMILLCASCVNAYLLAGFFPFLPKYIELQFHQTASVASSITGIMASFLAGVGIFLGGLMVSKMQLRTSQCVLVLLFSDVVFIVGFLINMTLKCDSTTFVSYGNNFNHSYVTLKSSSCSLPCNCSDVFSPVCGSDDVTYLSPCHAGCEDYQEQTNYTPCSCGISSAVHGICDSSCNTLPLYMLLVACGALLGFVAIIPSIVIILRVVNMEDRTVALAFSSSITNLTSFVPGPMLFGAIIDSTCLRWHTVLDSNTKYKDEGACVIYDVDQFRYKIHGLTIAFKVAAAILVTVLYVAVVRWQKRNGTDRTDRYQHMQDVTLFDITDLNHETNTSNGDTVSGKGH